MVKNLIRITHLSAPISRSLFLFTAFLLVGCGGAPAPSSDPGGSSSPVSTPVASAVAPAPANTSVASKDTTRPTVSISAPKTGATVSGTITVSATATDPKVSGQTTSGIAGVQFTLDGANLGTEVTASPYAITRNTASFSNGTHTLTAVARDKANNKTTSVSVSVTVANKSVTSIPTPVPSTPTPLPSTPPTGAQTTLGAIAASMQLGQWKELVTSGYGTGNVLIPSGGVGSILQYTDEAQWDPIGRKLYIIGCARGVSSTYECGSSVAQDAKWVMYNEVTNSWQTVTTPVTPFSVRYHSYDQAALDPATGDYFYRPESGGDVWRYRSGSWTQIPSAPVNDGCCGAGAIEYFPELGGLVLVEPTNGGRFHLYKPGTNSWSMIPGGMPIGEYHNITEYSKARQLLYVAGGVNAGRVLLVLDKNGTLTRATDAPVDLGISSRGAVHTVDPITGNFLVLTWEGSGTGNVHEYNPRTNAWSQFGAHPVASQYDTLTVAAPLPEYGVIMFVMYDNAGSRVYLYKHNGSF